MKALFVFILPTMLFAGLHSLWGRTSWRPTLPSWRPGPESEPALYWDPAALPRVQRQLAVLVVELQHLDDDDQIFARAFRTRAARSAYLSLLDDAARLTAQAQWVDVTQVSGGAARPADTVIMIETMGGGGAPREELMI